MLYSEGPTHAVWAASRAQLRVGERIPVTFAGASQDYPAPLGVVCRFGQLPFSEQAVLDTGASYTLLRDGLAKILRADGLLAGGIESITLATRFGSVMCTLHRLDVILVADPNGGGPDIVVEGSCAVPEPDQWPGPTFIGFYGVLECLRFAVEVQHAPSELSWLYLDRAR